mmetsp:Transcript_491/g.1697  ORF Transcript_491/g.1697 Transcript_491/m.1697 type:complete len:167 (+) Transcript_491:37-537(+)
MERLFVYGTLKRGFPNERVIPEGCTWEAEAETVQELPLIVGSKYFLPLLVHAPGFRGAKKVRGEVYWCTKEAMDLLDKFEGVDTNSYDRVRIDVRLDDGLVVDAWAYVRSNKNGGPAFLRPVSVEHILAAESSFLSDYTLEASKTYILPDLRLHDADFDHDVIAQG